MPDLSVAKGKTRTLAGNTEVAGWVEVAGTLVVEGDLACIGVSIEQGGTLRCGRLVANVVEVDNLGGGTKLAASSVRARLVSLVEVRGEIVADLRADYVHHFAGDLNPSFDYERGDRDTVEATYLEGEDVPLQLDVPGIRKALADGRNPFALPPLVERAGATLRILPES